MPSAEPVPQAEPNSPAEPAPQAESLPQALIDVPAYRKTRRLCRKGREDEPRDRSVSWPVFWLMTFPVNVHRCCWPYTHTGSTDLPHAYRPIADWIGLLASEIGCNWPVASITYAEIVLLALFEVGAAMVQHIQELVLGVGHAVHRVGGQRQVRHAPSACTLSEQFDPGVYGRILPPGEVSVGAASVMYTLLPYTLIEVRLVTPTVPMESSY